MSKYDVISSTAQVRHYVGETFGVQSTNPLGAVGLVNGVIGRERIQTGLSRVEHSLTVPGISLNEILKTGDDLPLSYIGIHPSVLLRMSQMVDHPHDPFWTSPLARMPKKKEVKIMPVEPNLPDDEIRPQVDLITGLLPQGSLNTIFFTHGEHSMWAKVPLASEFSTNPHQMSLPANTIDFMGGFGFLLLTTTPSITVPKEWKEAFPLQTGSEKPTIAWMNLHQVAHSMVIPTCWEYVDRTMSLVSPNELLKLTSMRLNNLKRWFDDYSHGDFKPDSTSYLYEVKVIQRALWVAEQMKLKSKRWLDDDLPWFRGLHFDEVLSQLKVNDPGLALAGLEAMDRYLIDNKDEHPSHALLNSAVFSTDYGTHPVEEVVVDVLAKGRVGLLGQSEKANEGKNDYSYWIPYYEKIVSHWQKWDKDFKG